MCFTQLHEAMQRGELILIEGGFCRYHLRIDGQLTIHDILSNRPGAGSAMLAMLKKVEGARLLLARVPQHLEANDWYRRRGFELAGEEQTKRGTPLNVWRLTLP